MSYIVEVYKVFRATGPSTLFTTEEFQKRHGKKLGVDLKKMGNATSILDRAGLLESDRNRPRKYKLKVNCKDVEAQARISALWKKDGAVPNGHRIRRTKAQMSMTITLRLASGRKVELSMVEARDLHRQLGDLFASVDN
jgi:hypothetical protein